MNHKDTNFLINQSELWQVIDSFYFLIKLATGLAVLDGRHNYLWLQMAGMRLDLHLKQDIVLALRRNAFTTSTNDGFIDL